MPCERSDLLECFFWIVSKSHPSADGYDGKCPFAMRRQGLRGRPGTPFPTQRSASGRLPLPLAETGAETFKGRAQRPRHAPN